MIEAGIADGGAEKGLHILYIADGFGVAPELYKAVGRDIFSQLVVVNKSFGIVINEEIILVVRLCKSSAVPGGQAAGGLRFII